MEKKSQIYLETSAWNFYFADDSPERMKETIQFFTALPNSGYAPFISRIVTDEINDAEPEKREKLIDLVTEHNPAMIGSTDEIEELAQEYFDHDIFSDTMRNDGLHVAHATAAGMDAVVSWNLKHIANRRRQQKVQEINRQCGFLKPLILITPTEAGQNAGRL